jgi:predicted dehydrogenase
MCDVCRQTGRIVQVGTQQRSNERFLTAIAMIRDGRLGHVHRATCSIGGGPTSPELAAVSPPKQLDWNLWLGPAAESPFHYRSGPNGETQSWSRGHYEFRWWYEYSGGKMTDWGAHHVDIATWALDKTATGPVKIQAVVAKHPVPFVDGHPAVNNRYNTATEFDIRAHYDDDVEVRIRHDGDNGILFEGTEGRMFVNRGKLTGEPVDQLATKPLADDALFNVYKHRPRVSHVQNFFEAVAGRYHPISDVFSHHRGLTTCHLAAISARMGRDLRWDPQREQIMGDPQAQRLVSREPRHGFAIQP